MRVRERVVSSAISTLSHINVAPPVRYTAEPGRHGIQIADNIGDNTTGKQNIGIICPIITGRQAGKRKRPPRGLQVNGPGTVSRYLLFSICQQRAA
jgi:hypothetical protein